MVEFDSRGDGERFSVLSRSALPMLLRKIAFDIGNQNMKMPLTTFENNSLFSGDNNHRTDS